MLTVNTEQLAARLQQQVTASYELAEHKLARHFPRPQVSLKLRGQSAGIAHLQENRLRFNPVLLAQQPDAFLAEVVPHEVAHLLVWQLFGKVKPHGIEWQRMMVEVFGLPPKVRHSFDVSAVAPKTWPYRCSCQAHALTVRRHNKVVRGEVQYRCRHCGDTLVAEPLMTG